MKLQMLWGKRNAGKTKLFTFMLSVMLITSSCQHYGEPEGEVYNINLSSQRLTVVPDTVWQHTELKYLDLGAKSMVIYPLGNGIGFPDSAHNTITVLPDKFASMDSLQSLSLVCNNLKALPSSLCHLPRLEVHGE